MDSGSVKKLHSNLSPLYIFMSTSTLSFYSSAVTGTGLKPPLIHSLIGLLWSEMPGNKAQSSQRRAVKNKDLRNTDRLLLSQRSRISKWGGGDQNLLEVGGNARSQFSPNFSQKAMMFVKLF